MSNDAFYYPQKMGRIIFLGMEEVIGQSGVNAVLRLAGREDLIHNYPRPTAERTFSFETVSALQRSLEQAYGPRGGRGLALRTGRSCFKYGLKEYGSIMGITETAFRLLPLSTKLHTGARTFADLFNKHTDQRVRLEETEAQIFWHIERCPLCWGRTESEPICHLAVGLLQEALYWLSGGKVFNVEETACIARGDPACSIVIDKVPFS
ncbi:MAG: 4-vinyl reductase [Chloroflexi bacterium]|nr:4-vinyl reductase [Chloroflexota bacterium]